MPILTVRGLCHAFGAAPLLDHAQFSIDKGERICLIGRNGEGKSTLLKIIEGEIIADEVQFEKTPGLRVASLPQQVPESLPGSVFDNVVEGIGELTGLLKRYHELSVLLESPDVDMDAVLAELSGVQERLEIDNGWQIEQRVEQVLSTLDLKAEQPFNDLSGGMKRRVLLAKALVSEPDLLILDEPTNHLDFDSIYWLEQFLTGLEIALLFVTHDRSFLSRVATRILELDRGRLVSFEGGYENYLRRKEEFIQAEEKQNAVFDKKLAEEEAWIRQGIKARRTRNEGRVRSLKAMREERAKRREQQGNAQFQVRGGEVSGRKVAVIKNLQYRWNAQSIVDSFSTTIWRGDKIGIIGRNGSGKTTFLKLLLGLLPPDSGEVTLGTKIEIAYFDQHREQLDYNVTLKEAVSPYSDYVSTGDKKRHIYSYLADFLFPKSRAESPVSALSGGEINRLLLAKLFTKEANVLVLDEPTNDLDLETLELLEERLIEYSGTVLIVSHDRTFLDRVVTSTIALDGKGGVVETVGGYSEYFKQRQPAVLASKAANMSKASTSKKSTGGRKSWKPEKPRIRSNREKRELDELPAKIDALESRQEALMLTLSLPIKSPEDLAQQKLATDELKEVALALENCFNRWEELESIPES